jgi:two-component system chemotaxis response regulator CheB
LIKTQIMIRVLIVDNSKTVQVFLNHILSSDPGIEVIGFAGTGPEAIELAGRLKPDVITIDTEMPGMSGYETSRIIMETTPTPIVIVPEIDKGKDLSDTHKYLEAGALAVILHPAPFGLTQFETFSKELIQTVKLMSEIRVVKLYPHKRKENSNPVPQIKALDDELKRIQVIAIGASTGGPLALQTILSRLKSDLPVPLLIVQHIAPGFVKMFQKMLSATSGIRLKIAEDGEPILAGTGYIAPDNFHMGVARKHRIVLSDQLPENGSKPSVSFLFRSVAQIYGKNSLGILLTGMGKDGADELKDMKDKGAITVVQNEGSSVVFGMPGEALKLGASNNALSPEKIAEIIAKSGSKIKV